MRYLIHYPTLKGVKYIATLLMIFASILLNTTFVSAQIRYVTPLGSGSKNGSSWADAYGGDQLPVVLDTTTMSLQIWVAAGTYRTSSYLNSSRQLSFKIKSGVSVYGGFSGTETNLNQRNWRVNLTIFSGNINQENTAEDNNYHVVVFDNVNVSAILDGITVQNGNANNQSNAFTRTGGGIYIKGGQTNVKILNCIVSHNNAITGGGIGIEENASPTIESCVIQNNNANTGGGLASFAENIYTVNANISKTFFVNNTSTDPISVGAAFNLAGGSGINTSSYTNCVFTGNNVNNTNVGGILAMNFGNGCTINITNCTFFNNGQGNNVLGKSFHYINQVSGTIHNSIFWNNGNLNITPFFDGTSLDVQNNIIQGGFIPSTNTIQTDPIFFNESSIAGIDGILGTIDDGLNISCLSPAKDVGLSTGAPATDIIGTSRPQNSNIDIGAYESLPPVLSVSIVVSKKNICSNSLVTFTATAVNAGANPIYQWKKNGSNVGTNSMYFLENSWNDKDSVSCEIASNTTCLLTNTATSNKIRIRTSQRIYVNASATGANDGTSWEDAYTSLQTAFANSLPCTPEIWVAKGVYKPSQNKDLTSAGLNDRTNTFKLPNTKLYGGFAGNETSLSERDAFGNRTILSGDIDNNDTDSDGNNINENYSDIQGANAYNVVTIIGSPVPMSLDGFVITGGNASSREFNESLGVTNNKGGGIVVINASNNLKIANCLITGNSAYRYGGGIMIDNSNFSLENCIFHYNDGFFGGGIFAFNSFLALDNTLFLYNNSEGAGGGLLNANNTGGHINHCVFYKNEAPFGAAIQQSGDNSLLFNVKNSIIWDNYGEAIINSDPNSSISVTYCDINGTYAGFGNLWVLPRFQNINDLDGPDDIWGTSDDGLKLACNSDLIDNASSSNLLTDIAGNSRPYNSAPDIGAYEYIPKTPSISIAASNTLCESQFVTITPTVSDAFGFQIFYQWKVNGINVDNSRVFRRISFDGDIIYCEITILNPCTDDLTIESNHITVKGHSLSVIYVDAEAGGNNNGSSWDHAFKSLQSAINLASSCDKSTQIWVKSGTYYPSEYAYDAGATDRDFTFTLRDNLGIYGGFSGGEGSLSQRNLPFFPTILSGDIGVRGNNTDNCYHVVVSSNTNSTAILDGFTIRDGNADGIGSVEVLGNPVYRYGGGGIFTTYSSTQFNNSLVQQNTASTHGGGIYFDFGSPALTNTVVANNNATAGNGGGMFAYSSSHATTNCVFDNNRAGALGGGLYQLFSNSVTRNSTFYNNTATTDGGGIYHDNSAATIINSIVWGNTGGGTKGIKGVNNGPYVTYSNVQGGFNGTGNINANPLFSNTSDTDGQDNIWKTVDDGLQLNCGSPSINTGTNTNAPDMDILKVTRPLYSTVDMGVYESVFFTSPPVVIGNEEIEPGQTLHLEAHGAPITFIKWYASITATIPLSTVPPLNVSPVTNTTYYVTASTGDCESSRLAVPVVITLCLNNPAVPNYAANSTATLKSRNTMTAANTVGTNAKVNYQAVNSITLSPGFSTGSGAVFKATIEACN